MNWTVLIIFGIAAIALIAFLVLRNKKDEKDFEKQEQVKEEYDKPKDESSTSQIDEVIK